VILQICQGLPRRSPPAWGSDFESPLPKCQFPAAPPQAAFTGLSVTCHRSDGHPIHLRIEPLPRRRCGGSSARDRLRRLLDLQRGLPTGPVLEVNINVNKSDNLRNTAVLSHTILDRPTEQTTSLPQTNIQIRGSQVRALIVRRTRRSRSRRRRMRRRRRGGRAASISRPLDLARPTSI